MTPHWDVMSDTLNEIFERLANDLAQVNPRLWWNFGHNKNEVFPFWAYASFSREGIPGEEDLVISLSFKSVAGGLEFDSDIARGDGEILADGPADQSVETTDLQSLQQWVDRCIAMTVRFIADNSELLRQELA